MSNVGSTREDINPLKTKWKYFSIDPDLHDFLKIIVLSFTNLAALLLWLQQHVPRGWRWVWSIGDRMLNPQTEIQSLVKPELKLVTSV
jgi:hypothetical protein